jgi:hypothetical protein
VTAISTPATVAYDILFPGDVDMRHARGEQLLGILGLSLDDVGPFCDSWIERAPSGLVRIVIYTGMGSGIRTSNADVEADAGAIGPGRIQFGEYVRKLMDSRWFLGAADEEYDPKYAAFYFRLPADLHPTWIRELEGRAIPYIDTAERWRTQLRRLNEL